MHFIDGLPSLSKPGVTLRNRGRSISRNPNESTPDQEVSWDKLGYKKTGGEVFIQLKAFDPTKDTPVEMLHVMLLEITKYVFQTSTSNFLNADMLAVLENLFRTYSSKAFDRKLNSSMRLYKSFLGRDFKIMVQTMPVVFLMGLKSPAFLNFRNDHPSVFQAMFNCFDKLGELSSMIYMEKIKSNFAAYLVVINEIVEELVSAIDTLHHTPSSLRRNRRTTANNLTNATQINNTLDESRIYFETSFYRDEG